MKKSNNLNHVLEVFWLIVGIMTAILGLYILATKGFKSSYIFFIMSVLAFLLYLARHTLRLKEKDKANE
jgi:hypothetical protein